MIDLFNRNVFDALCADLGEVDTIEVLKAFLADTAGKMTRVGANWEMRPLIRQEAHSVKSSAATFGFDELAQAARGLELTAETLPTTALRDAVHELQSAFERVRHYAETNLLQN